MYVSKEQSGADVDKHTQRLLLEEQEARVDQLNELGQVVEVVEDDQLVGPATLVRANSEEEAVPCDHGDEHLSEESQKHRTNSREVKVVNFEEEVQRKGLAPAHQLAPPEDYNVVCEESNGARLQRRHWRLAGHEAEVLRLEARDGLERGLEEGP